MLLLQAAALRPDCHLTAATKAKLQKTSLKDAVRAATIDNFQGEESTIVILSLVRCNE